jgi:hypothetical protein
MKKTTARAPLVIHTLVPQPMAAANHGSRHSQTRVERELRIRRVSLESLTGSRALE